MAIAVLLAVVPGLGFTSDTGGQILQTFGGAATLLAAAVALTCFRSAPSLASVSLLLALACQTASTLLLVMAPAVTDASIGPSLASGRAVSALAGAALLMCAALAPFSRARANTLGSRLTMLDRSGWRVIALGVAISVAAIAAGFIAQPAPSAFEHAVTAAMFAVAAVGFATRAPHAAIPRFARWLAVGSALAAGARIDYLLIPPASAMWVSLAELLIAASTLALAAGALRELESAWHSSRERAAEEERRRLARELHDGVAQELAFILGQSRRLAQLFPEERALADISAAAEHALQDSRSTIYGLQRRSSASLGSAVEARAQTLARRAGLELTVDVEHEIASSAEAERSLLSIVQEAISNAARHGEASKIDLSLHTRGGSTLVKISDDGRGFEPEWQQPSETGGFGLWSMQERARALGGDLSLSSAPGDGTTIEVAI